MTKSMETAFREDGYLMLESLFSEEEVSFILHQLPMLMASETPHVVKEKNGQVKVGLDLFKKFRKDNYGKHLNDSL